MIIGEADWNELAEYREALEHTNRKGSHWYQHIYGKFQKHAKYARGSSGPSGERTSKRAKKDADAKAKAEKKAADEKAKAEKKEADAKAKAEKQAAKKEKERKEILSDPRKLYKHRKEFTYEEIKDAVNRFKQESELRKYSKEILQKGADFIDLMNTYTTNAINLYNTAARIINTIKDDGKSNIIPFIDDTKSDRNKSRVKAKEEEEKKKKQQQQQQQQQQKQEKKKQQQKGSS